MKKYPLIILILIVIAIPFVWWATQSSLANGVHLEQEAGSIVIQVEEDELTAPLHIPVTWVKVHPWEKPPILKDLVLLDHSGEKIASIQDEFQFEEDVLHSRNWYDREISGELVFELNADKIMKPSGYTVTPFSTTLKELYIPSELQLTYEDESFSFSLENKLQLYTIKQDDVTHQSWQTNSQFPAVKSEDNDLEVTGQFINISGETNSQIEEILFWLPGMPEDYYENYVQYTVDKDVINSADISTEFTGETLELPLKMSSSNVLFYFPFTEEMKEAIGDSRIYIMPYLKTIDESGNIYYHGGSGSVGSIVRGDELEFQSILIK